jgi:hypothetical protein
VRVGVCASPSARYVAERAPGGSGSSDCRARRCAGATQPSPHVSPHPTAAFHVRSFGRARGANGNAYGHGGSGELGTRDVTTRHTTRVTAVARCAMRSVRRGAVRRIAPPVQRAQPQAAARSPRPTRRRRHSSECRGDGESAACRHTRPRSASGRLRRCAFFAPHNSQWHTDESG